MGFEESVEQERGRWRPRRLKEGEERGRHGGGGGRRGVAVEKAGVCVRSLGSETARCVLLFFPFFLTGMELLRSEAVRCVLPFFPFFLTGKELLERCRQRMDAV